MYAIEGKVCLLLTGLLLTGGLLAACGGGGGGGGNDGTDDEDLVVVKMALVDQVGKPTGSRGATNAYRNNRVRLTFSAKLDPASVDDRTIQVGIPSGGNLFLTAQGRFSTDGNKVLFDPTVTATGAPNPFGFEPNAVYQLSVQALPAAKTVQTETGKQVLSPFQTSFTTTDQYLPDLDQPRVLSVSPLPDTVDVESRADVVVEFSEAMNPVTFDSKVSFKTTNLFRNREVFGTFRFSDDAKTVTFRPTFGYGRGPYEIRVELTVDLTDLALNPIANPQTWTFTTIFDPTAVNEGLVEEYFDDNVYEDTAFVGPNGEAIAKWNDPADLGRLGSVFGVSTVQIPPKQNAPSGVFPPIGTGFWANARAQVIYKGSEVKQAAGTITQVHWYSYPGYSASGNVWTGLTVKLGMSSSGTLTSVFANNFNVGSPVTMASNVTHTVPQNNGNTYLQLPTSKNFNYNGKDSLVLDIAKSNSTASSNAAWGFIYEATGRYMYGTPSTATSGTLVTYFVLSQFGFRTEDSMAQSLWYRADSPDPIFLEPVISPTEQPAGTEVVISWEGAAADDTTGEPDPATFTGMTEDITELDGHEFLRFQIRFTANLGTGVGPGLDEVLIPYIFF